MFDQPVVHDAATSQCYVMFAIGGRETGWPLDIAVNEQPSPLNDIAIRRRVPDVVLGPIDGTGEESPAAH